MWPGPTPPRSTGRGRLFRFRRECRLPIKGGLNAQACESQNKKRGQMKNVLKIMILILLVFQISCGVVSEEYTVKYISDGDTITVTNNKTNKKVKVRLFGIDAPEKTQEYGLESKEYLMSLIKDKVIIVKGKTYDKYGRLLGTIYIDGMNVNEMMVQTGNAWWYESFDSKNSKVRDLQIKAKEGKLGLWKNPNAIEPEEYRRKEREKYKK